MKFGSYIPHNSFRMFIKLFKISPLSRYRLLEKIKFVGAVLNTSWHSPEKFYYYQSVTPRHWPPGSAQRRTVFSIPVIIVPCHVLNYDQLLQLLTSDVKL